MKKRAGTPEGGPGDHAPLLPLLSCVEKRKTGCKGKKESFNTETLQTLSPRS